ncbi:MAG: ribonuclease J [Alphaproteobacteria bacterium]
MLKFKKNTLYFIPLGGSGEIGMNLNLYQYNGKWLMVDLGVTFDENPGIEVVMPDIQALKPYVNKLVGVVLTHAHEDHIGAVPHLWQQLRCPLYATPFTAEILRHKLKETHIKAPLTEIPLSGTLDLDPFHITFISLTHSILEPNALAIRTPAGTVLHTGDWKIDPDPMLGELTDEDALKKVGDEGVLAMVCDSTNVFEENHSGSERDVRDSLLEVVKRFPESRVLISCFASNAARLATCAAIGEATGRSVALVGRSLERVDQAARSAGYFQNLPPFLTEHDLARIPKEKVLLVCTGSQGEARAALSRIAQQKHSRVRLDEEDAVVFSSRVIPGNEKAIFALQNQLARQGVHIVTHRDTDFIHVSGHPSRSELKEMYGWVRPHIAVPVHGEDRHLIAHAELALELGVPHAFPPRNGQVIELSREEGAQCVGELASGRIALDGKALIPYYGVTMHNRLQLATSGFIQASVALSSSGKLKGTQVDLWGLAEPEDHENLRMDVEGAIASALSSLSSSERSSNGVVAEVLKKAARQAIFYSRGKKPMTHVQILRVHAE